MTSQPINPPHDFMEEARELAAQCWCDKRVSDREIDSELTEVFAERVAFWMGEAALVQGNSDFYRGLLVRCGNAIGRRAYITDDGGLSFDVLIMNVPEIIESDYKQKEINMVIHRSTQASEGIEGTGANCIGDNQPPVNIGFSDIENNMVFLERACAELVNRLGPVCAPCPDEEPEEYSDKLLEVKGESQISHRLNQLNTRIQECHKQIVEVFGRLEI